VFILSTHSLLQVNTHSSFYSSPFDPQSTAAQLQFVLIHGDINRDYTLTTLQLPTPYFTV